MNILNIKDELEKSNQIIKLKFIKRKIVKKKVADEEENKKRLK